MIRDILNPVDQTITAGVTNIMINNSMCDRVITIARTPWTQRQALTHGSGWGWSNEVTAVAAAVIGVWNTRRIGIQLKDKGLGLVEPSYCCSSIWSVDHAKNRNPVKRQGGSGWGWSNEVTAAASSSSIWRVDHAKNRYPVKRQDIFFFSYVLEEIVPRLKEKGNAVSEMAGRWGLRLVEPSYCSSSKQYLEGGVEVGRTKLQQQQAVFGVWATRRIGIQLKDKEEIVPRLKENGNAVSEMAGNKMGMGVEVGPTKLLQQQQQAVFGVWTTRRIGI
ncbi:hypothetical protein CEXT_461201 [Caerostris extrusa]|uniref:Uncharacterized protein n=1 Tax=Caerostris extrusa TaxID=172846 RepID=A0AAV4QPG5_CAEEX|nr:hypothetical protein CEXT_461201 [Caerostris extrusa]